MKFDQILKKQKRKTFRNNRFQKGTTEHKSEQTTIPNPDEVIPKDELIAEMFAEYKRVYHTHPPSEKEVQDENEGERETENQSISRKDYSNNSHDLDSKAYDCDSTEFTSASGSTISSVTMQNYEGIEPVLSHIAIMLNGFRSCFGVILDESDVQCGCHASMNDVPDPTHKSAT